MIVISLHGGFCMIKIIPYTTYKPVTEFAVEEQMKSVRKGQQTVFIVPESVKASVERLVFDRLVKGKFSSEDIATSFGPVSAGTRDIDVLSFVRLSYKILSMTGKESFSDDSVLRNLIYRVPDCGGLSRGADAAAAAAVLRKKVKRRQYGGKPGASAEGLLSREPAARREKNVRYTLPKKDLGFCGNDCH